MSWLHYFCPHCGLVVNFMGDDAPIEPMCEECGAILEPEVEGIEQPAGDGLDIPEFLLRVIDLPKFLPMRRPIR